MPFLNDDHRQIVLGTLLGNGYMCRGSKNAYLCIRHCEEHLPWLQSKISELVDYQTKKPMYKYKNNYLWRSISDPLFTEIYKMCYKEGVKTVSMEWLDPLRDLAIAVWYGDSGCLLGRGRKNACLRTQSFGYEGNQIIEKYFNEVGMPCSMNKSRNSWVIMFTVAGTEILMSKIVAPNLPQNRYFKIIGE